MLVKVLCTVIVTVTYSGFYALHCSKDLFLWSLMFNLPLSRSCNTTSVCYVVVEFPSCLSANLLISSLMVYIFSSMSKWLLREYLISQYLTYFWLPHPQSWILYVFKGFRILCIY